MDSDSKASPWHGPFFAWHWAARLGAPATLATTTAPVGGEDREYCADEIDDFAVVFAEPPLSAYFLLPTPVIWLLNN